MIKTYLISWFFLLGIAGMNAQTFTISGVVADSSGAPLEGGTVMLLQAKDSVLQYFGLTNKTGEFVFKNTKANDYLLQISYLGYQNYYQPISVQEDINLGEIRLQTQVNNLNTVVVEGERIPISINKDTIVYNAGAFSIKPNDNVEQLLKQLPGVQVERDGTIKAQGETVTNVLVDGKEFFGKDPKMATKNLPADAVDKVQVFDKKSDMAEFSGIDDGREERTINLQLKEDKKQGYFGNVTGGYGTEERFQGKANINRFSSNQQLSFIGMANNINEQGFSFSEYMNFMGGLENMFSGEGGGSVRIRINPGDLGLPINSGNNDGLMSTYAGGLNLNQELNDKTEINGSYFLSHLDRNVESNRYQETYLSDKTLVSEQNGLQHSQTTSNRLNMRIDHKIDSTQNVRLRASGGYSSSQSENSSTSQSFGESRQLQNRGERENQAEGQNKSLTANALYRKRLGKKGRTFSTTLNVGLYENNQDGFLNAVNTFFDKGEITSSDTIRQNNHHTNSRTNYGLSASYTEPLSKGQSLLANYSFSQNNNEVNREVFDLLEGEQKVFNSALSNRYDGTYRYNRGGLTYRYNKGKTNFSTGVGLQHSELDGDLLLRDTSIHQSFLNWLPSLRLRYAITNSQNMEVNYETFVQEPAIEQLQPVVDNSDPLDIFVGNPDLKPEYFHDLGLRYFLFDQFSMTNVFVNTGLIYTHNKIQYAQTIDEQLVRTTQPINVEDDYSWRSNVDFGTPIRWIGSRLNFNAGFTYNWGTNFLNAVKNKTQQQITSLGLSLESHKLKALQAAVGGRWDFNKTKYSISQDFNQNFLNQSYYADLTVNLPLGFSINSTFDYRIYDGTFSDRIPIWNGYFSKMLLKDNRGQLKLSVFDLLNQNAAIHRQAQLNFYQEERFNSLGRYFMLSFTYSLQALGASAPGMNIRIIEGRR